VSGEDAAIASELATVLRGSGVDVRLDAKVTSLEATARGKTRLLLDDDQAIDAEQLILAVGRTPATAGLGLGALGISPADDGALTVDPYCRVQGRITCGPPGT
jgi:dihydrolipoamide dehydrogenase